ncbi:CopG family transcriptional regulator [Campylobacter upsaliensis]|nr:CopG family transcriptional regulator [Campylobacter upsaliensis]EFN3492587.1 CopG family transcriptional regulator [Campylobacter jejuni]EAJ0236520.1 CopG family transcriptional regulator [Campylobacter upsaliensis]EAJ7578409.1 CopG family transcriptional regulator [Campylobacter upsaliensis]EAK9899334.1 CopG family transcriptional regulator [Campylobacter upsaliensis]
MLENLKADKIMVSLPHSLNEELKEFAREFKVSKSGLISQALDFYFDTLDLELAKQRTMQNNKRLNLKEMKAFIDEL